MQAGGGGGGGGGCPAKMSKILQNLGVCPAKIFFRLVSMFLPPERGVRPNPPNPPWLRVWLLKRELQIEEGWGFQFSKFDSCRVKNSGVW